MHIILNHSSMVPIYEQLMEQIKTEIIESALVEGEALPSVRKLAGELRISALTVKKAYDKLEESGFVTTVHGSTQESSRRRIRKSHRSGKKCRIEQRGNSGNRKSAVGGSVGSRRICNDHNEKCPQDIWNVSNGSVYGDPEWADHRSCGKKRRRKKYGDQINTWTDGS